MLRRGVSWKQAACLLIALLCATETWFYWHRLTSAGGNVGETETVRPAPLTDLYPRWYGSRELLLHHRDPYGVEVSQEIQRAFYGHVLDRSQPGELRDEQRFAYPLYVVYFLAPFVAMPFESVRLVFWWLLAMATASSAILWSQAFRISLAWIELAAVLILLLGSIGVVQGLSILQLGLLVSLFISAAGYCAVNDRGFLAGAFLALATIKPQLALFPVAWFALWAASDRRRRWSFFCGFGLALGTLVVTSEYLQPDWLIRYPSALRAYAGYVGDASLLGVLLFHSPAQWLAAAILLFVAGRFCWRERRQPAQSTAFAVSLSFALTITVIIVPTVIGPFNHVLLLPVVFLLIRYGKEVGRNVRGRIAAVAFCVALALPFFLAMMVTSPLSTLGAGWAAKVWLAPLSASLILPLAAFYFLLQASKLSAGSRGR